MNQPRVIHHPARQAELDFVRDDHWRHLPESARKACADAIARLMHQILTEQSTENTDEREDPGTPS